MAIALAAIVAIRKLTPPPAATTPVTVTNYVAAPAQTALERSAYPLLKYLGDQVDHHPDGRPAWTNRVFGIEENGSVKPLFKLTK